jgi:hypothetical protein
MVTQIARWHTPTSSHLARMMLPVTDWHPQYAAAALAAEGLGEGEWESLAVFRRKVRKVSQRLGTLRRVARGAPVGSFTHELNRPTWYVTPAGIRLADLPFQHTGRPGWTLVAHAWFACDIGVQLEATVLDPWQASSPGRPTPRLVSEKELRSGTTVGGDPLPDLRSVHTAPDGKQTGKWPDLAVVGASGRFVAVEVERTAPRRRPIGDYEAKIRAYEANPNVAAVWYVCATEGIAAKVQSAAQNVLVGGGYPLRVHAARAYGPMLQIGTLAAGSVWMEDLGRVA